MDYNQLLDLVSKCELESINNLHYVLKISSHVMVKCANMKYSSIHDIGQQLRHHLDLDSQINVQHANLEYIPSASNNLMLPPTFVNVTENVMRLVYDKAVIEKKMKDASARSYTERNGLLMKIAELQHQQTENLMLIGKLEQDISNLKAQIDRGNDTINSHRCTIRELMRYSNCLENEIQQKCAYENKTSEENLKLRHNNTIFLAAITSLSEIAMNLPPANINSIKWVIGLDEDPTTRSVACNRFKELMQARLSHVKTASNDDTFLVEANPCNHDQFKGDEFRRIGMHLHKNGIGNINPAIYSKSKWIPLNDILSTRIIRECKWANHWKDN